jgi:hypothetical protein
MKIGEYYYNKKEEMREADIRNRNMELRYKFEMYKKHNLGSASQNECYHCNSTARDWHHPNGLKETENVIPLCKKCHIDTHSVN